MAFQDVNSDGMTSSLQESTACAIKLPSQAWYNNPLEPNPPNNQYLQVWFLPITSFIQPKSGSDPRVVSGGIALRPALAPVKTQSFIPG